MAIAGVLEIQLLASVARLSDDMRKAERVVGDSMTKVERSVEKAKRSLASFGAGISFALVIDQVRRMTDSYTKLDAQIRLSTKTQAQYNQALSDIRRISSIAQADISATSMLYTRLTNVMRGSGIEQSKLATVTETVTFGLKAYGATAAEASSAALQLSQAMGANRLGGEEFRAVMEAMPNVMKVLADSMGVPLGELRALSIAGKITAEQMVKAFGDPAIAAEFKKLAENAQTVTGAFIVVRNEMMMFIGELFKSSGITGGLIVALKGLADGIRTASLYIKDLVTILGVWSAMKIASLIYGYVTALVAVRVAALAAAQAEVARHASMMTTMSVQGIAATATLVQARANMTLTGSIIAATTAMRAFLLTNPIGWATLAISAGIIAWQKWGDEAEKAGDKGEEAISKAAAAFSRWERIRQKREADAAEAAEKAREAAEKHQKAVNSFIDSLKKEVDTVGMTSEQVKLYEAAKLGMTMAQITAVQAMIAHITQIKLEEEETKKLNEQLADGRKAYSDYWESVEKSTEAINKQAEQLEWENKLIGKTKEEIHALTMAREHVAIATAEQNLAALLNNNGTEHEIRTTALLIQELYRLKAAREGKTAAEAAVEASKVAIAEAEKQWKMIDGFAKDAFMNITDKGKNAFKEIGNAIKKYVLEMLYKMTLQKWLINVGVIGGTTAAGNAMAGGMGGGMGGFPLPGVGNAISGLGGALGSSALAGVGTGMSLGWGGASAAASAYSAAGMGMEAAALQIGAAMPYIGAAVMALSLIGGLFGGKGTPGRSLGAAAIQFDPAGAQTGYETMYGGSNVGTDKMITDMQTSYMKAAMSLGIGTVATEFRYAANTGRDSADPQFGLSVSAGGMAFGAPEQRTSEAAVQLAASRAIFTALQGSELPQYLANLFNGLTAGSMTQQDIDNTLAFASSLKQMRDALLETRTPLEVLRAEVQAGGIAFATSAATFRNDFVAAIDAGISPEVFEQWKALGTAIDQLAAADAEIAARAAEAAYAIATKRRELDIQIMELTGDAVGALAAKRADELAALDISLRPLQERIYALEDERTATEAATAAARTLADAMNTAWDAMNQSLQDARNAVTAAFSGVSAAVDAERTALTASYNASLKTSRTQLDAIGRSVSNLRNLAQMLADTTEQLLPTSRASAQAQISAALAIARAGGGLPDADSLRTALDVVSQPSEGLFSNFVDYQRDFMRTANDIAALSEIADTQLSDADLQLAALETQIEVLESNHIDQMLRLDGILEAARIQANAALGVGATGTVADANAALTAAINNLSSVMGNMKDALIGAVNALASGKAMPAAAVTQLAATIPANTVTTMGAADVYRSTTGAVGAAATGTQAWQIQTLQSGVQSIQAVRDFVTANLANPMAIYLRALQEGINMRSLDDIMGWGIGESAKWAKSQGLPTFAVGTDYVPYDMTANIHQGERITPAAYNRSDKTNADLVAEIKALRQEIQAGNIAIASASNKTARVLDRWDGDGIPAERVV